MVTAICNIFINSDIKLKLFKETFSLVYAISDNWLINIRGKYREDVVKHIQETFEDYERNCIFFSGLDDGDWARSTQKMLEKSKYDYIYVFLEDHFLLKPLDYFKDVIRDMQKNGIDYFQYSFFNNGVSTNSAEKLYPDYTKHFFIFELTRGRISSMQKEYKNFHPYSLASICSKSYFLKLLGLEEKTIVRIPMFIQILLEKIVFFLPRNHKFWFKIKKIFLRLGIRMVVHDAASPFNLEKTLFDCNISFLPLKIGGLKEELFANWDDDAGINNSSLIKRGLYPMQIEIPNKTKEIPAIGKIYFLKKNLSYTFQYFPDLGRILRIPKKYIFVEKGSIKIISIKEVIVLKEGNSIWIASNIQHTLYAEKDSEVFIHVTS